METKKFQRKKEDFVCQNCGFFTAGNGYTNHCPKCLWSMHVDINPGDRLSPCGGIMEPVSLETKSGQNMLIHKCQKCGFERKNRLSKEDNFEKALKIAKKEI